MADNLHTTWAEYKAERVKREPGFARLLTRWARFPQDTQRWLEAPYTRRAVQIATRKYRARKGGK